MTRNLPQTMQRLAAASLLLVPVGAFWLFAAKPALSWLAAYDDDITRTARLLERSLEIAAQRPALAERFTALNDDPATESALLTDGNTVLVAAQLQNRVERLIVAEGGTLKSIQTLPVESDEEFRKIAVRLSMTVDTPALQRILYALETGTPYLFLGNLEVRAPASQTRTRDARQADILQVRFDAFGFVGGDGK